MGALDWIARRLGYAPAARRTAFRGGFGAADYSRLTASLASETEYINTTLRYQLHTLRARSRQAAQNNPYARRFVALCVDNVAGPDPFRYQAKVRFNSGALDEGANARLEQEWRAWGKRGSVEITGEISLRALIRLMVRNWATDGEVLIRKIKGRVNRHALALQMIDVDRLDESYNESLKGGGGIHMGIERDAQGRPVAYHLLKRRPSDWLGMGVARDRERVPAGEIFHFYIPEFAEQSRGVPPMYAALLNLVHLGAFSEAAVIAARVGAAQMGVITSPEGQAPTFGDGTDAQNNPQIQADPGTFPVLPQGYSLESWNPKYPDAAVEPFLRSCLMGVSAGLNVAYHSISSDLTGVNFSSGRLGELDEREHWEGLQTAFIENFMEPLHADWFRAASAAGALPSQWMEREDKYLAARWVAKTWRHIQPREETEANIGQINAGLKSRTQVVAESGRDIEDVFEELAQEQALAEAKGVRLEVPASAPEAETDQEDADKPAEDEMRQATLAALTREPTINVTTPPVDLSGVEKLVINAELGPVLDQVKALQAESRLALTALLAAQEKQGGEFANGIADMAVILRDEFARLADAAARKPAQIVVHDARGRPVGTRPATPDEVAAAAQRVH